MTISRKSQTVWLSNESNAQLLVQQAAGQYYVPLSHIDLNTLMDLALAVEDALLRAGCSEKTALPLSAAVQAAQQTLASNQKPPTPAN